MGIYLSTPNTVKESQNITNEKYICGFSSMQGWRSSQEDAHNMIPDFCDDISLFAVYDGHGGSEVAKYTSENFPTFLKNILHQKENETFETVLEEAFLEFDEILKSPKTIKELTLLTEADCDYDDQSDSNCGIDFASSYLSPIFSKKKHKKHDIDDKQNIVSTSSGINLQEEGDDFEQHETSVLKKEASIPLDELKNKYAKTITKPSILSETTKCLLNEKDVSDEPLASNRSQLGCIKPNISFKTNNFDNNDYEEEADSDFQIEDSYSSSTEQSCVSSVESEENGIEYGEEVDEAFKEVDKSLKSLIHENSPPKSKFELCKEETIEENNCGKRKHTNTKPAKKSKIEDNGQALKNGENGKANEEKKILSNDLTLSPTAPIIKNELSNGHHSDTAGSGDKKSIKTEIQNKDKIIKSPGESNDSIDHEDIENDGDKSSIHETDDEESADQEDDVSADEEEEGIDMEEGGSSVLKSLVDNRKPSYDSGCTAVVGLIKNGKELYVANIGDSRCILNEAGKAVDMSLDHKPEDTLEKDRIVKAGGVVTEDGRVNEGLNLSRAFGDHYYKEDTGIGAREQLIIAFPDIKHVTLTDKHEFLVLACDGIWNSMTSQEVVDFVNERKDKYRKTPSKICEELFDNCLAPHTGGDGTGCDNMTCIIVFLKHSLK